MKRKLVSFEGFEKLREDSLSSSLTELVEVQNYLAKALDCESLILDSFNESSAIFAKDDGTYLQSTYSVENDAITFENLEELVIDEATEKVAGRKIVADMLEAVLDDNDVIAKDLFEKYMDFASQRHQRAGTLVDDTLEEGYVRIYGTRGKTGPKVSHRKGAKDPKRVSAAKKAHRLHGSAYKVGGRKRHSQLFKERKRRQQYKAQYGHLRGLSGGKQYKRHMNEMLTLAENVISYVDHVENGFVMAEAVVKTNAAGDITSVRIPTSRARNEGKIIAHQYKNLANKDNPKIMRENAFRLPQQADFCKAVAELKRFNNVSDNDGLQESLNGLVTKFPSVLYLTQEELAKMVSAALENAGATNYDDQTCVFMAEGILRAAHGIHSERVERIMKLANAPTVESDDSFLTFQNVVKNYFPTIDEATQVQMKVFEDLYNAVLDVRQIALEVNNDDIRNEASDFISELEEVLKGQVEPDVELASDVAEWLEAIAEANLAGASDTWSVVKNPHYTYSGDHPQMSKNAKQPGVPGQYPGDWGDPAPMIGQDSMAWKHGDEARNRSWGNKGGKDVWPALQNPYILKPFGDYHMKEPNAATSGDDDWSRWRSGDTFPELQNPYVPKTDIRRQKVDPSNAVDDKSQEHQ